MPSPETLAGVAELYQNECFGDLMVDAVLPAFPDPAVRKIIGTIAQFETETKARLRPFLMQLGLSTCPAPDTFETAEAAAAVFRTMTWHELMLTTQANIRDVVVPRFQQIAAIAAADGDLRAIAVADYMVIHELALLELIDRVLAGEPNPARGVEAMLHFPLTGLA